MTIGVGVEGYTERLTQFGNLKRRDVNVSLAGNDAVMYLVCVCVHVCLCLSLCVSHE